MPAPVASDRLAKIRASAKRWAPRVAATAIGAMAGVSLATFTVRAVSGFAADKSGTVMAVAAVLAIASANAAVWWMWGRHKTADVRAARAQRQDWMRQAGDWERTAIQLQAEVDRLAAENDQLRRAEVSHLPAKQTGDQS